MVRWFRRAAGAYLEAWEKDMFCPRWFLVAIGLGALLLWPGPALAQESPATAEQVIAKYIDAIGGPEKIAAIKTFFEEGDFYGTLPMFPGERPSTEKQQWSFQSYFKAPNLRFKLTAREGVALDMSGCDGKVSWSIGRTGHKQELKPKPGNEYECQAGFNRLPLLVREPSLRIQLKGKKRIKAQLAWEIKVQDPKSATTDSYFFDAETYLLLRSETSGPFGLSSMGGYFRLERTYSDYREVGGIKLPFVMVTRTENSEGTTTVREVQINPALDDARFEEPGVQRGKNARVVVEAPPPAAKPDKVDTPALAAPAPPQEAQPAPEVTYVNATNFVSSSLPEVQVAVPELKGLKPAEDQHDLTRLLDKVGAKTVELVRKIPNLISNEEVAESQPEGAGARKEFSYLILAHRGKDSVTLEEYRADLYPRRVPSDGSLGAMIPPASAQQWEELARTSARVSARQTGAPPLAQGFASMWIRFYPSNRPESDFRYLGRQKIDGHQVFVLAFAQKPGSVRMPGEVRLKDETIPVYYQGIAWVDASDFRIVRLRTDLLAPLAAISLTRLTAEIEFANTQAAGFAAPLWLPKAVEVTSELSGRRFRDLHSYSKYRSFQVHTKILLDR
jgi:hypothetical protein